MKSALFTLLIWTLLLALGAAVEPRELTEAETKVLLTRAKAVQAAFEAGDTDALLSLTHPAIYKLASREEFQRVAQAAMASFKDRLTIEKSEWGIPSPVYRDGENEVCFLPKLLVMKIEDTRARSTGFLVAARGPEVAEWLFLDSASLEKQPQLLWTLFPGLPKDVKTPPNKTELLR